MAAGTRVRPFLQYGGTKRMQYQPQTWHYGIVAQHWAEFQNFSVDAPEIAYYQRFIEKYGQPALDVACGTGRLLLPYLRAGLDVDGCDISPDMLALCRQNAEGEGFAPGLTAQAMHQLDLPRLYRTIFVCGSFGIGSTRAEDALALRRFYAHLAPGGALLLDQQMPYGERLSWCWKDWLLENRQQLDPDFWTEPEYDRTADGREYRMRSRLAELDPLEQTLTLQMRAELWQDEQLVGQEERTLTSNIYFKNELLMLLKQAGFDEVTVQGDFTQAEATPEHGALVFIARK
jgi:SAM-dependent methyltransferase